VIDSLPTSGYKKFGGGGVDIMLAGKAMGGFEDPGSVRLSPAQERKGRRLRNTNKEDRAVMWLPL
jgi:hypothetical protein